MSQGKGIDIMTNINNLNSLSDLLNSVPDGTTADILASDLEAGNFDTAHLVKPDGTTLDVTYTGPVAEGYVSPFEAMDEEE
jgi:hypothetical protein